MNMIGWYGIKRSERIVRERVQYDVTGHDGEEMKLNPSLGIT